MLDTPSASAATLACDPQCQRLKHTAMKAIFFAAGIYNQYIYVQPKKDLVIVKLTANHHFKTQGPQTKDVHIAMMKAIAEGFMDEVENDKLEVFLK